MNFPTYTQWLDEFYRTTPLPPDEGEAYFDNSLKIFSASLAEMDRRIKIKNERRGKNV